MYNQILNDLKPYNATLIAVSKTKPNEAIQKLYDLGQRHFGENKVQELVEKHERLPKDIAWHQIGHLQKNKVKYIAPFVELVHAVDSLALLETIEKEAAKNDRVIKILLQVKIAQEDTKYGLDKDSLNRILELNSANTFKNISIVGLMGMASFTEDHTQVSSEFALLKQYFDDSKDKYFKESNQYNTISMGMSGDYKIALQEGSTMVRIGSLLFGSR